MTRFLDAAGRSFASRYPEWSTLDVDTRDALTHDLLAVSIEEDATLGESLDILHSRLTAGGNPADGVLTRYGASIVEDYRRRLTRVAALDMLGFDRSEVSGDSVHIACSQCEALAINGTATHERGCPNTGGK